MNYNEAQDIIVAHAERVRRSGGIVAAEGNLNAKKLKNRTWLEYDKDGGYHLRYFNTRILTFYPMFFELNDGNFFSHSTHQRFNEFMPKGFHISGCTYPELGLKRPLGFLRTPCGTYPYNMPATYYYDGRPYDHKYDSRSLNSDSALTDNARIVSEVPKYVDKYLNLLLSGTPCDETTRNDTEWLWHPVDEDAKFVAGVASRNTARFLKSGETFTYLAEKMTEESVSAVNDLEGMPLKKICDLLAERGSEVFKKPKTRQDIARRLEDVLYFECGIPNITIPTLKRKLRQPLIEYIVDNLGFEAVEWNRRPR